MGFSARSLLPFVALSVVLLPSLGALGWARSPSGESPSSRPNAIFLDEDGKDSRVPMPQAGYPWSAIGRISRDNGDGTRSICTGALVGPSVMLTNAHCVLVGNKVSPVAFRAQYARGNSAGSANSLQIVVGTTHPDDDWKNDWAVVQLDAPLGEKQGWFDVSDLRETKVRLQVTYAGYSDNFEDSQVASIGQCSLLTRFRDGTFGHDCSMGAGGSGGPLFVTASTANGHAQIVAVNSRGYHDETYRRYTAEAANIAVMNSQLIQAVLEFRQLSIHPQYK